MRALVVVLGLALWSIQAGWAEPVYFVIDASGSMDADERADAIAFVAETKESLVQGSRTSTTFFGSAENGGNCGSVVINPLMPVIEDVPDKYDPGNFTPVGTALRAALDEAAANDGRVIVVSDGADTCEVDVCEVVRRNLRRHPTARRPEFMPIGASDETIDAYGCFVSAVASSALGIIAAPTSQPKDTPVSWVFGLMVLCALLMGLSVVLGIRAMEARARDLKKQINTLTETGTACVSEVSRWRYAWAVVPAVMSAMITLLTAWLATENFFLGWDHVWWFVNLPFGSMLLPAVFVGFAGWALLEMWNIDAIGRQFTEANVKVQLEKQRKDERNTVAEARAAEREQRRQEREASKRAEYLARISDSSAAARKRQNEFLAEISLGSTNAEVSNTAVKLNAITDAIEELIAGVESNQILSSFSDTPRTDYPTILNRLLNRNLITADLYFELDEIFKEWSRFLSGRIELKSISERITEFDIRRLRPRSPPDSSSR
tara:strand:+ start:224 stop:1699 length:1476 start_codon:yes stop_codon:yes gene_type:complete